MITIEALSQLIRNLRCQNGLSQSEIANRAGLSLRHYQDIEYGNRRCRIDTFGKILEVYGLDFFNFFDTYILDHFFKEGAEEVFKILDPQKVILCRCDNDGLIRNMSDCFSNISGFSVHDFIGKLRIWDMALLEIDRSIVKIIHQVMVSSNPFPITWTGFLGAKNNKAIRMKAFWRKKKLPDGAIDFIEVLAIPMAGAAHTILPNSLYSVSRLEAPNSAIVGRSVLEKKI